MKPLLSIAIVVCLVSSASADPTPAPLPNPGSAIGAGVVQALIARRADLSAFAGTISRSTTHEAIAEGAPELGKALREDIASNGALSQAVKGMTVIAVHAAIETSSAIVRAALSASCEHLETADCVRGQARRMSQEVTGGVMDELEQRWPMRILSVTLTLFLLTGIALMLAVLRRVLREDHLRAIPLSSRRA